MKGQRLFACTLSCVPFLLIVSIFGGMHQGRIAHAAATTWYVSTGGNDGNDCLTSGTACATIAEAINKALDGDTIEIAAGTYNEHDIEVSEELTLNGAGMTDTIVDAGGNGRVFWATGDVEIANMRLINGLTTSGNIFDEGGGAILASGTVMVRDVRLDSNEAVGSGGAIFNNQTLVLENTQIISNTANGNGGGIYNYTNGVITVSQSLISGNIAVGIYGGGIHAGGDWVYLQDSTIANNRAASFGGGTTVNMSDGATVIERVTFRGNEAAAGGALFSQIGTVTMTNGTVSHNNGTNNHGGIYVSGPSTSIFIQNSTIAYNTRTNTAGNGFNGVMWGNNATIEMVNTILANNQENNCASSSPPTSLGYNLSTDLSCGLTQMGDLPGTPAQIGMLANYGGYVDTHALLPNSAAIDAGENTACAAVDARGIARPYDGDGDTVAICDMGAVEARHQLLIADSTVLEGDAGSVTAVFTVTLAPTSTQTVMVDYETVAETAVGGSDYTPISDTLTFNPGETEKYIQVSVTGDTDDELDETFRVQLSAPVNADLLDAQAIGTIIDNDGLPTLSITDDDLLEGNSGTNMLSFDVILSPSSLDVVTVTYMTTDDSATAGEDYTAVNGTLIFQPGETEKTVFVETVGDIVDEGDNEIFTVDLSNAINATVGDGQGIGTITDDDSARLSHEIGPQTTEGDSGLKPAVFTITLSTPADFVITVDFEASSGFGDDGAIAGVDFEPISGTVTFQPGETVQNYAVQIIGDTEIELDERFHTLISNANVPITVNGSSGTILDDDSDDDGMAYIYLPFVTR